MKLVSCLATLLALVAVVDFGHAQAVGDRKEGLALAQQVCSRCHATVAEQVRSPNSQAPRFPDLAATPGMTRTALLVALTTPHAGMLMFTLTGEQRDDIIAYILSLHYRERNLVERFFQFIKQFRGIATRYEKTARNFLAGVHLVCALAWLK